ncbi:hypothetical protein [Nocardia cyriacigeorgica]|uniref:hypothetical protein n=1 Tax=Nocardia cyriacigeorgica TaxID=135487 RepID=UPI00189372BD|nr:hypothetical protein [Nocardia cyriacigeorgica]MBF6289199.1 hypothetical protein [Nocardia cyriacigeorgica]
MNDTNGLPHFENPDGLDEDLLAIDWDEVDPEGARNAPTPEFRSMSVAQLYHLVDTDHAHRGGAVLELLDRSAASDSAARAAGELGKLPLLREDRIHRVSMTWAVIAGLLAAGTPVSRACAYDVFYDLSPREQEEVLGWLKTDRIESAQL